LFFLKKKKLGSFCFVGKSTANTVRGRDTWEYIHFVSPNMSTGSFICAQARTKKFTILS
jgi:hypothetical protein